MKVTASGLVIPGHMNDEPKYKCNIPGCDWLGYNQREQVNHALSHAGDEDLMADLTYSANADIMGEGDPERFEFIQRRHRQLVKEVGPKEANDPRRY